MKAYTIIILLILNSCNKDINTTKPNGFPYNINIQELEFKMFTDCEIDNYQYSLRKTINNLNITEFNTQQECDSVFKLSTSQCKCENVDFNHYKIINVKFPNVEYAESGYFQTKVTLNQIKKALIIDVYRNFKNTGTINSPDKNAYTYDKWLIVPKPPENFYITKLYH